MNNCKTFRKFSRIQEMNLKMFRRCNCGSQVVKIQETCPRYKTNLRIFLLIISALHYFRSYCFYIEYKMNVFPYFKKTFYIAPAGTIDMLNHGTPVRINHIGIFPNKSLPKLFLTQLCPALLCSSVHKTTFGH